MSQVPSDEISLTEIWQHIFRYKLTIILSAIVFAAVGVGIALSLPNKYTAKVVAIPNQEQQSGLRGLANSLGGLAGMAGLSLGTGGGADKTEVALEVMRSQRFIVDFVDKHNLAAQIIASKGGDLATGELIYDEEIYDITNKKWLREAKPPKTSAPTPLEKYDAFMDILEINYNPKSGFVELSIEFYLPSLAKSWLELLVKAINNQIREESVAEAKSSIAYLEKTLKSVENTNMQTSFYQLIEEQTKILMLADANPEFALKTISPAVLPERKSKPNRLLIVVAGGIVGGMLSFIFILMRYFIRKDN